MKFLFVDPPGNPSWKASGSKGAVGNLRAHDHERAFDN
jgi:hypothetical protein